MFKKINLTYEKLCEVLKYDPETGNCVWKKSGSGRKKSGIAGCLGNRGRWKIGINRKIYLRSRLAWLYIYGYFPEYDIDHIDGNKSNDSIKNLRHISHQCNSRNCGTPKNNTSEVKGVCWYKRDNKWRAYVMINFIQKNLGFYKSFDEAVCARLAGEQCLDWEGCDSSSPAYKYVKRNIKLKTVLSKNLKKRRK